MKYTAKNMPRPHPKTVEKMKRRQHVIKVRMEKMDDFIEGLKKNGGRCYLAARAAGVSYPTIRRWYEEDPDFAEKWDEAEAEIRNIKKESMEAELYRRAVEGVDKPVFQAGQQVGTIREYSDTLLIQGLKAEMPEKYVQATKITPVTGDGRPIEFNFGFMPDQIAKEEAKQVGDAEVTVLPAPEEKK